MQFTWHVQTIALTIATHFCNYRSNCNITVCIHSNGFILSIVFTASVLVRHRFPMHCYSFIIITLILLSSLVLCRKDRFILLAKTCQCACVSIICNVDYDMQY